MGVNSEHKHKFREQKGGRTMGNKLLQMAIENGQAKEYYGSYLIYPRQFLNSMVLDALLQSLNSTHNFYNIMGTIKAMPKLNQN